MVVNLDKGSGDTVHLTLLSDEEYQVLKAEVEQAQAEAQAAQAEEEEVTVEPVTATAVESQANAYESEIEPEYQLGHQQVNIAFNRKTGKPFYLMDKINVCLNDFSIGILEKSVS